MHFVRRLSRILPAIVLSALLAYAAVAASRFGRAAWLADRGTADALAGAVRLVPRHARYQALLGEALLASDREAARAAFERALALDPYDAGTWVRLGLYAEMDGDLGGAEERLLRAAAISHRFWPRSALAGFYFRTEQTGPFWHWAREAAALAPGDATPLYRLCWRRAPDPDEILRRVVPDSATGLRTYLSFLFSTDHADGIQTVACKLAAHGRAEDAKILLDACELAITRGRLADSLRIWNALCGRRLLPYQPADPKLGVLVTNADFETPPLGIGFDWRTPSANGVSITLVEHTPSLRLWFSGSQAERAALLSEFVPVSPGEAYRLAFRYRTSPEISDSTGLRWQIVDMETGEDLGPEATIPASGVERSVALPLRSPPRGGFVKLALAYERTLGTTRIRGRFTLHSARLEPAQ